MSDEKMYVEFHYGALCNTLEQQANEQGLTFGDYAEGQYDGAFTKEPY